MTEPGKITRIAAVGDIHVRENERGKWTEYFKEVSRQAQVLLYRKHVLPSFVPLT